MVYYFFDQLPLEINLMIRDLIDTAFKKKVDKLEAIFPQLEWTYVWGTTRRGVPRKPYSRWMVKVLPEPCIHRQSLFSIPSDIRGDSGTWVFTPNANVGSMEYAMRVTFPTELMVDDADDSVTDESDCGPCYGPCYDLVTIGELLNNKEKLFLG